MRVLLRPAFGWLFPVVPTLPPSRFQFPISPNSTADSSLELPPFVGTAEEAIGSMGNTVASATRIIVAPIAPDGSIMQDSEQIRLTSLGQTLTKTIALCLDDQSHFGDPKKLKGCCGSCGRVCFNGDTCGGCGGFFCRRCMGMPDTCVYCLARLQNNHWALFDLKRNQPSPP